MVAAYLGINMVAAYLGINMVRSFLMTHNYTSWHSTLQSESGHSRPLAPHFPKRALFKLCRQSEVFKEKFTLYFHSRKQSMAFTLKNPIHSLKKIHTQEKFWVRKSEDILEEDFNNLWVLNRLFVF